MMANCSSLSLLGLYSNQMSRSGRPSSPIGNRWLYLGQHSRVGSRKAATKISQSGCVNFCPRVVPLRVPATGPCNRVSNSEYDTHWPSGNRSAQHSAVSHGSLRTQTPRTVVPVLARSSGGATSRSWSTTSGARKVRSQV